MATGQAHYAYFGRGRNDSNRNSGQSLRRRREGWRDKYSRRGGVNPVETDSTPSATLDQGGLQGTPPAVPSPFSRAPTEIPAATQRSTMPRARVLATTAGVVALIGSVSTTLVSWHAPLSPSAVAVLPLRALGDSVTIRAAESIAEEVITALAELPGNYRALVGDNARCPQDWKLPPHNCAAAGR